MIDRRDIPYHVRLIARLLVRQPWPWTLLVIGAGVVLFLRGAYIWLLVMLIIEALANQINTAIASDYQKWYDEEKARTVRVGSDAIEALYRLRRPS